MGCARNIRRQAEEGWEGLKQMHSWLSSWAETERWRRVRTKKNTERTKVMRETVEYAVGIFHGSIMAIQSGGEVGAQEWNLSFRRRSERVRTRFIRKRAPENGDVLSNALSIHPRWDTAPVFSFRFRATERKKVRDGVSWWDGTERQERKRTANRGSANGIGEFVEPSASRTSDTRAKRDEKTLLRNLWSGYVARGSFSSSIYEARSRNESHSKCTHRERIILKHLSYQKLYKTQSRKADFKSVQKSKNCPNER